MKAFIKKEEGSVTVLAVLAMVIFLALLALVLDGGQLYLAKNRLQKVSDASTLAGAQDLPKNPAKAEEAVRYTIEQTGLQVDNLTVNFQSSNTTLKVSMSKKVNLIFANALGIEDPIIQATATVQLLPLTSGKGAVPLGVEYSADLSYGNQKVLKVGESTVGNFGALALTGPGAKDYEIDLKNGYEFTLKVGDVLETQTGNIVGPTKRAIDYRLSLCPNSTYINYSSNCSRIVLVPVFKAIATEQNQVKQVQVVGFSSFFLESVTSTSTGAEVIGRFIEKTYNGNYLQNQTNYGTYGFKLLQ